jgi:hypothetical protein
MDNLRVHKSSQVRKLIEEARASVLLLPPYWPDFSPMEEALGSFLEDQGDLLGRIEARTHEAFCGSDRAST